MYFRSRGRFKLDESKNMVRQAAFNIIEEPNFKQNNITEAERTKVIFKANANFLMKVKNIPVRTFFRSLNNAGIKYSMNAWIYSMNTVAPNVLLIVTFARILGVTPSQLLDPSLPDYYHETQEPKP